MIIFRLPIIILYWICHIREWMHRFTSGVLKGLLCEKGKDWSNSHVLILSCIVLKVLDPKNPKAEIADGRVTFQCNFWVRRMKWESIAWQYYRSNGLDAEIFLFLGTFIDCLLGQWWANVLQLGDILPKEHVMSTLEYIYSSNHVDSFNPGMANCSRWRWFSRSGFLLFLARRACAKIHGQSS